MRQHITSIALGFMTLAVPPALGASLVDSVFQVSFRYAGSEEVVNDTAVPLLPDNACYAWYVRLGPGERPTAATETLSLPVALADWGDLATNPDDGIDISADGKTATRRFDPAPDPEGWFSHSWCVVEGDPTGRHTIEVAVEGETLTTFDFDVVLPEDYSWPNISQPMPRERSVDHSW
jgi:hypothetical protein